MGSRRTRHACIRARRHTASTRAFKERATCRWASTEDQPACRLHQPLRRFSRAVACNSPNARNPSRAGPSSVHASSLLLHTCRCPAPRQRRRPSLKISRGVRSLSGVPAPHSENVARRSRRGVASGPRPSESLRSNLRGALQLTLGTPGTIRVHSSRAW